MDIGALSVKMLPCSCLFVSYLHSKRDLKDLDWPVF